MVSQPTMRRIFGLPSCLVGLTAGFLFLAACGQNEGGRCQIDSDCASGLECSDTSGNGTCRKKGSVVTSDAAPDMSVAAVPEVGPDMGPDTATVSAMDAEPLDAESVDTQSVDTGVID